ncbi:hypothetical protein PanWU01x14_107710 [Parasponia andersonii]|uniref:Uncharacterized protein n=1 Tax=Parasponia andersonii TaxID=3476 RepID=A0A2P5D0B3_PARAD|nr:hypothetical protein PanWU01x14_107710 [Parasponia andersonii]
MLSAPKVERNAPRDLSTTMRCLRQTPPGPSEQTNGNGEHTKMGISNWLDHRDLKVSGEHLGVALVLHTKIRAEVRKEENIACLCPNSNKVKQLVSIFKGSLRPDWANSPAIKKPKRRLVKGIGIGHPQTSMGH